MAFTDTFLCLSSVCSSLSSQKRYRLSDIIKISRHSNGTKVPPFEGNLKKSNDQLK